MILLQIPCEEYYEETPKDCVFLSIKLLEQNR